MQLFCDSKSKNTVRLIYKIRVMDLKSKTLNFVSYLNLIETVNKGCPRNILKLK